MLKRKNLLLAIFILIFMFSSFNGIGSAFAGELELELLNERFGSRALSNENWYSNRKTGIDFESTTKPILTVSQPVGGSSITSKTVVTGGAVKVQLDIESIDFGDTALTNGSGWFGVAYNIANLTDGLFYMANQDPSNNSDGVYFQYHEQAGQLVFATMKGRTTNFVNGSGTAIAQKTQWSFFDASMITDQPTGINSTKITQKTLIIEFFDKGMTIKMKDLGAVGEGDVIIKNSPSDKNMLEVSAQSYVGLGFVESTMPINSLIFSDFKLSSIDGSTVFNQFNESNIDNYKLYAASSTSMNLDFDACLILNDEFSAAEPLLIRKSIQQNEANDFTSYFELSGEMNIKSIAENSRFGVVSGINLLSTGRLGQSETTYVYFTKTAGTIKCSIESYHENDIAAMLKAGTEIQSNSRGNIDYIIKITNSGRITVTVNDNLLYQSAADNEAYTGRYIGYALNGESSGFNVEMYSAKLTNRFYDRPANADLYTDFTDNKYNKNDWYLYSSPYLDTYTNSAYVRDEQLMFENVAMNSGFSTQRQFSNFEMQFDITDIRREVVYDSLNNKVYPISSFIGVFFGTPTVFYDFGYIATGADIPLIYIEAPVDQTTWDREKDSNGNNIPVTIRAMGNGLNNSWQLPARYDYWDSSREGEILQFKVRVEEKNVTVSIKYDFDEDWYSINMTMKKAITGHISLCTMGCNYYVPVISEGASCGYFKADNFAVTNLDNNPNHISYELLSSKTATPVDFNYVSSNNDNEYLIPLNTGISFKGIIFPALAVAAVLGVAAGFIVYRKKGKKRYEK